MKQGFEPQSTTTTMAPHVQPTPYQPPYRLPYNHNFFTLKAAVRNLYGHNNGLNLLVLHTGTQNLTKSRGILDIEHALHPLDSRITDF